MFSSKKKVGTYNKTNSLWQQFGKIFPKKYLFHKNSKFLSVKIFCSFFFNFFSQNPIIWRHYRTCQLNSPPPQKSLETLRTGHFYIVSAPYMMAKIHKKQNFVILSGMHLPWYKFSWWKWHRKMILTQSIFSEQRQKNFYGRVSILFFSRGGELSWQVR